MIYKATADERDFDICRNFAKEHGIEDELALEFPTIMAFDDTSLVGFIATQPRSDMILAGPLVLKGDKPRPFTAMRLCELYEQVMMRLGITSVIFGADPGGFLDKGMRRWFPDVEPYATNEDGNWFIWKMTGRRAKPDD